MALQPSPRENQNCSWLRETGKTAHSSMMDQCYVAPTELLSDIPDHQKEKKSSKADWILVDMILVMGMRSIQLTGQSKSQKTKAARTLILGP